MRYRFGDYLFDTERYELHRAGVMVPLRPKECDVLAYLLAHRDRVVSKDELLEQVWPGQCVGDATLHVRMLAVRKAIGDDGTTARLLRTVRGRGYRFVAPVVAGDSPGSEAAGSPPAVLLEKTPVGDILPTATMEAPSAIVLSSPPPGSADTGEHKVVTVLCGGLAEAADWAERLGTEAIHTLMQTLLARVQHIVQRYGGTLVQVSGEGFVGLFGAPVAHEDHARRAVLAAVELRQCLQEETAFSAQTRGKRVILRWGLHTGPIVVVPLPYTPQQLFTALGATTTLAAALQQLAPPDAIFLSAATYELVQAEIHGMPAGTLNRVGQPAPIPIYTVQGVRQRHGGVPGRRRRPLPRYVGRERELAVLHDHLGRVRQGQGQVIGIIGEPGMGKSRLLYEFVQQVAGQAVTYYEGHCLPYGTTTPYGPILDVLRQHCGLPERASPSMVTAAVHRVLAAAGLASDESAPFLLQLLNVSETSEPLAQLSPQARRVRTFALLRQIFLHTSRQQPLVLGIENGHWLDATSEEWLLSLVEQVVGVPFLLLSTYRPGYTPPWAGQSVATQIALAPLPSAASRVIVQAVAQGRPLPEGCLQEIVATAAGNPFFLEELTQTALAQDGAPIPLRIPETIQAVLAARIDHLPAETKRLVQTAAIIGHNVPLTLLQTVADGPETALQQHLRVLQHAEILYEQQAFPEAVYAFNHALTHEVVYSSLLQEQRRTLHARMVERLEALDATRRVDHIDRLAHHALRGEVWDKAVAYCRQVGTRAMTQSAYHEAAQSFAQALDALQHLPEEPDTHAQAIDLRLDLRSAIYPLGELGQILVSLQEAAALAEALGDQHRLGWVSAFLTTHYTQVGEPDHALTCGQRTLAIATHLKDVGLTVMAQHNLGQVYRNLGDYRRAVECFQKNVAYLHGELLRECFGLPGLASVISRSFVTISLAECGAFAAGRAPAETGVQLAEAADHPYSRVQAYRAVGFRALRQGDCQQAIPVLERALALAQGAHLRLLVPRVAAFLGAAYALAGRITDALPLLEQAVEQAMAMRFMLDHALRVAWLSEAYLLAGRLDEASTQAQHALVFSQAHQEQGHEAYALRLLGECHARHGPPEVESAATHYRQALTLAEALGMRPLQAHCHHNLGTLYSQRGWVELAQAELTIAVHLYRSMDMTLWLPQAEAALAQVGMQGESMNAK
jgi:DNA-binding winged helix-turn-helix (wHTH) protein/class 3 adenylate cyclase/tetratricopeptide (TPR) repeat protein